MADDRKVSLHWPEVGIGHHLGEAIDAPLLLLQKLHGNRARLEPASRQRGKLEFTGRALAGCTPARGTPERWEKARNRRRSLVRRDAVRRRHRSGKQVFSGSRHVLSRSDELRVMVLLLVTAGDRDSRSALFPAATNRTRSRLIKQLRKSFDCPKAKFVCASLPARLKAL